MRRDDPLTMLHELNKRLYDYFDYVPKSTKVDSPIDVAIESKQGVCQDFAHIMIALVRQLGIPCRYVSGYLHHSKEMARPLDLECHARLGRGAAAASRLGRLRSDQLPGRDRPPHPHRDRARLCRRPSDQRHLSRPHQQRPLRRRARDGLRRASRARSGPADSGRLVDARRKGAGARLRHPPRRCCSCSRLSNSSRQSIQALEML